MPRNRGYLFATDTRSSGRTVYLPVPFRLIPFSSSVCFMAIPLTIALSVYRIFHWNEIYIVCEFLLPLHLTALPATHRLPPVS